MQEDFGVKKMSGMENEIINYIKTDEKGENLIEILKKIRRIPPHLV